MKLLNEGNRVVNLDDDTFETSTFSISMGPKMFHILSDGLYSDKIRACIRELSTNALDSHIANGNAAEAFEVHIPTWSMPEFYIRDFGTGMSKETIQKVFSTYGMSSKDNSNLFNGCLGLGSKTPFSYHTRTFNITSWYNGIKYEWRAFLNKDGVPSLSLLSEVHSPERSGVKISFPTVRGDESAFANRATDLYKYFTVKPKMVGNKLNIVNPEYSLKKDNWGIRKGDGTGCRIIMASVAYPVVNHSINNAITSAGIDIFVETGDVSIEVSREGLSYDAKTIAFIENTLNKVKNSIQNMASESYKNSKNLYESRLTFIEYYSKLDYTLQRILNVSAFQYNNQQLFPDSGFTLSVNDCRKCYKNFSNTKITVNPRYISLNQESTIFYDDLAAIKKKGSVVRLRNYVANTGKAAYLFEDKQSVINALGCDDSIILPISSVTYQPTRKKGVARAKTSQGMRYQQSSYITKSWASETIDFTKKGVYCELHGFDIKNSKIDWYSMSRLIKQLNNCSAVLDSIFGLKSKLIDSAKNAGWTHIDDYLKDETRTILKNNLYKIDASYPILNRNLFNTPSKNLSKDEIDIIKSLDYDSDYKYLYDMYQSFFSEKIKEVDDAKVKVKTLNDKIEKLYPMLQYVSASNYTTPAVKNYVRMIDSK
jgi:hypothetical protein